MSTACSLRWSASLINGECMTWSSMTIDALDTYVRSLSYHVRSCTTSRTSMRSTRPVAVLSCPVVHDPTPWPKLRELDSARTGHAHLNNQVQPQRRGRVMLVPTKIDLTVDAERHKTFKVPPFLQALEHSSDCERSSQRVEKKSSISSIKNTGKAQTPSPPNGHARFWVNEEIWARSLTASDFSKVTRGSMPPDPLALEGLGLRPSFCRLYTSWLVPRNIPECVKHVLPVWQAEPCQPEVQLQAPLVVLHDAPFLQLQLKAHPGPNLPAWQAMRRKTHKCKWRQKQHA